MPRVGGEKKRGCATLPKPLHTAYLVHSTTFSPVELTLLLLAQTVASAALGSCSPSGLLPCAPLSLTKPSLEVLEGAEGTLLGEASRSGDTLGAGPPTALPAGSPLSGESA